MIDPKQLGAIYLGSPYSDPSPRVRRYRYLQAKAATVALLKAGAVSVYSPIAMLGDQYSKLPKTWDFWQGPSFDMLRRMDSFVALTLAGWMASNGLNAESTEWRSQPLIQDPPGPFPHLLYMCPESHVITEYPLPGRLVA